MTAIDRKEWEAAQRDQVIRLKTEIERLTAPAKRGRPPLAADVVRLELRVPALLAAMAEERAESRGITTAALWREAMHAHLGAPREVR